MTNPGYATNTGRYTKIGNVVYFSLQISANSGTNTSFGVVVSGLPFTPINVSQTGGAFFNYVNGWSEDTPYIYINANQNNMSFYRQSDGNNFVGTHGGGLNGRNVYITGFYYT